MRTKHTNKINQINGLDPLCALCVWVLGLFKGVTGIVMDPLKGAKRDGVTGFAKGVGTGILGVVAKPVAGVIDLASDTLEGLASTPGALLDSHKMIPSMKKREARFIPSSGCVLSVGCSYFAEPE
jgi:hypothetical protein